MAPKFEKKNAAQKKSVEAASSSSASAFVLPSSSSLKRSASDGMSPLRSKRNKTPDDGMLIVYRYGDSAKIFGFQQLEEDAPLFQIQIAGKFLIPLRDTLEKYLVEQVGFADGFQDLLSECQVRVKYLGEKDEYNFGFQKFAVALYTPGALTNTLNLVDGFLSDVQKNKEEFADLKVNVYGAENVPIQEWRNIPDKAFSNYVFQDSSPKTVRSIFVPFPPWRNAAICIVLDVQSASRLHVLFGGDTYQFRSRLIDFGYALQQTSSGQWWHKWSLMDVTSERDMTQFKNILGPGLFCNAAVFVRVLREPDVPALEVTGAVQKFLQDLCVQDQIFMMPV